MYHYFSQLPTDDITGSIVLLDIDGTLLPDGETVLDRAVLRAIEKLKRANTVMICSNNGDVGRLQAVSQAAAVPLVVTTYKKPHVRVLESVARDAEQMVVVIGDKYLTDGRFADKTRARFIQVKRLRSPRDRWHVRLAYLLDDAVYFVTRFFCRPAENR